MIEFQVKYRLFITANCVLMNLKPEKFRLIIIVYLFFIKVPRRLTNKQLILGHFLLLANSND